MRRFARRAPTEGRGPLRQRLSLRGLSDVSDATSLSARLRAKRFALFRQLAVDLPRPARLLDVGGTVDFWLKTGMLDDGELSVTVLNVEGSDASHPAVRTVVGDATSMPQYTNGEFDVVFSNSVIEHVGGWEDQKRMASEVQRVGTRLFLQTPSKWFPIEPHFLFPFFGVLPTSVRAWLIRRVALGRRPRIPDRAESIAMSRSVRLLTRREMRQLFPDATFVTERFAGLTKSYIVHQGW